jgi:hypothetical protein
MRQPPNLTFFEETVFRYLSGPVFIKCFHPHIKLWGNVCRWCRASPFSAISRSGARWIKFIISDTATKIYVYIVICKFERVSHPFVQRELFWNVHTAFVKSLADVANNCAKLKGQWVIWIKDRSKSILMLGETNFFRLSSDPPPPSKKLNLVNFWHHIGHDRGHYRRKSGVHSAV